MKRLTTHGVVYRKTMSGRHLTLPFDGDPKLIVTTKGCTICGEHFPLAHFYTDDWKKNGLRGPCVECWDDTNGRKRPEPTPDGSLVNLMA